LFKLNTMIGFTALVVITSGIIGVECRSYTDNLGVTHTTDKTKPTIVTWAHRAVSLSYYGLDETQLIGTYGEWGTSGSDFSKTDPEASSLPMDPSSEDVKLLQSVVNLSPTCGNEYCVEFDLQKFEELNPDEFIIHGYRGSPWAIGSILPNITEILGKPPIFLEISMDKADECLDDGYKTCAGLSMIEVIDEQFELAKYLDLDTPSSMEEDRINLCKASSNFRDQMKIAQDKGLRIMPAYLTTGLSYYANVKHYMVLRMFEELGMPIMHNGACLNTTVCSQNYFWEYVPIGEYFQSCDADNITASCNNNPLYPVDVWLYDHRTTLSVTNPDFAVAFPDKAIISKQYAFWPIGGRIVTPHHAAKILNIVGSDISSFERIHSATDCKLDVDVSSTAHKTTGLDPGEYACFNPSYHNTRYFEGDHCSSSPSSSPTNNPVSSPSSSPVSSPSSSPVNVGSTSPSMVIKIIMSFVISLASTLTLCA